MVCSNSQANSVAVRNTPVILDLPTTFTADSTGQIFNNPVTHSRAWVIKGGHDLETARRHLPPGSKKISIPGLTEAYLLAMEPTPTESGAKTLVGNLLGFSKTELWIVQLEIPLDSSKETVRKSNDLLRKVSFSEKP